jgi:alkylmercury lyase-like protein
MDDRDVDLRNRTYARFVESGLAPVPGELGDAAEVLAGWRRLHDAHALVLNAAGDELRMLNPFSIVPSAYRVCANDRWWYANCAWDAFGVLAAFGTDGRIETSCPDCAAAIAVEVVEQRPHDANLLFHCLVPAAQWWDDIAFT